MISVSVIIPVFNAEKYLSQCLDSIVNQTLTNIEIICVDDGSTDTSFQILKEYEEKDSRVIVLSKSNAGAGTARNEGLKIAKGKYLSFLDADDFFERNMLECAYGKAEQDNADICIFESDLCDVVTKNRTYCDWSFKREFFPKSMPFAPNEGEIRENIFRMFTGWAWDKLFRREFIENHEIKFQNLRTTNDMFFVYFALIKAERITVCPGVFAHQRINNKKSLSNTRELSWNCFYQALLYLKSRMSDDGQLRLFWKAYVNWALNLSLWHLNHISDREALKIFKLLKYEGLSKMGISQTPKDMFFNQCEYETMKYILGQSEEDFLLDRINGCRHEIEHLSSSLRNMEDELRDQRKKIQDIYISRTYRAGDCVLYIPKLIKKWAKERF